jgi:hypothetical protein
MANGQRAIQPDGYLCTLLEMNVAATASQNGSGSGSHDGADAGPFTASHQSAEDGSDAPSGGRGADGAARLRAFDSALFGRLAGSTSDGAANPASSGVKALQRRYQGKPRPVRQQNVLEV